MNFPHMNPGGMYWPGFEMALANPQHYGHYQAYWPDLRVIQLPQQQQTEIPSRKRTAEKMEERITLGGKWTAEEEAYASLLITHFRSGALTDCQEGTTLRSYLAEKLECIPMRISKKFAGDRIGKEVFRRGPTRPEINVQLNHVRELFIESTSKKRKRMKRKLLRAAAASKSEAEKNEESAESSTLKVQNSTNNKHNESENDSATDATHNSILKACEPRDNRKDMVSEEAAGPSKPR